MRTFMRNFYETWRVWWEMRAELGWQLAADRRSNCIFPRVRFMRWYSVTQSNSVRGQTPGRVMGLSDSKYHEVKTCSCPWLKPQTEQQRGQYCKASGHRVRWMIARCLIHPEPRLAGGQSVLVCTQKKRRRAEQLGREMAGNKGWGLRVHSFWTIPGTRIPVPRDPLATPPVRHLFVRLQSGECKTTTLAFSTSAVQTHLKNNTFLSFISYSGIGSYLWAVLVADWNLLPLFSCRFVSEGIRKVYGSGWTVHNHQYKDAH